MEALNQSCPERVAVFTDIAHAERAVSRLMNAGYTRQELTVICAERHKERFHALAENASRHPAHNIGLGSTLGAAAGGAALAAAIATGGLALLPAGIVLIGGGALAGAF